MKKETLIIIILLAIIVWFGSAIVRLENYHYANQVGFCEEYTALEPIQKENCLNDKKTRTSFVWHLLYGLKIIE